MGRAISRWAVTICGLSLAAWGVGAMLTGWDQILIERGWSLFIGGAAALAGGAVTTALGQVIARLDRLIQPAGETRSAAADTKEERRKPSAPPEPKPPLSKPPLSKPLEEPVKAVAAETKAIASQAPPSEAKAPAPDTKPQTPETKAPTPEAKSPLPEGRRPPVPWPGAMRAAVTKATAPSSAARTTRPDASPPAGDPVDERNDASPLVEVDRYESGETVYVMFSNGAVEVRSPDGVRRYTSLSELRAEAALRQI